MRRLLLALTLLICFGLSIPAFAENFTKEQIEKIVQDYIMKNPKVLIDSVNAYGQAQQQEDEAQSNDQVLKNKDWLLKNKNHAEAGNPKGDVTIVEFFDYNCGYCKKAFSDIVTLLKEDKNIRLVFADIPILGSSSLEVAHWSLASSKQGKYFEFHSALMNHHGAFDETTLSDYAKKAGLDVEKLKKDKAAPDIQAIVQDNIKMSGVMGISGTPAFVVGDQVIRGYVGLDGLRQAVQEARKKETKPK
jgi:protein-disulfide isomerase